MAERFQRFKAIARQFGHELGSTVPEDFTFMEQQVITHHYPNSKGIDLVGLNFILCRTYVYNGLGWTEQNRQEAMEAEQNLTERGFLEIGKDSSKRITERGVSAYHQIRKKPYRDRLRGATFQVAA